MHIGPETLKEFATGRVLAAEAEQIEQHLLECDQCGLAFDEIDRSGDFLLAILRKTHNATDVVAVAASAGGLERNDADFKRTVAGDTAAAASARFVASGRIDRYELQQELGHGGMGVVYKAYDPSLRRHVALKIIAPHRVANDADRGRFRREAESAARLQHANIVQIFEFGEQEGVLYGVLELVDGKSLDRRLAAQGLSPSEAAAMVATLADAVEYAHARKVIHRDLKPGNVLFTADGTPKIADFGLAKILDDDVSETVEGTLLGSPCYMAPEQAAGKVSEVGPATDVHALGGILYESLTGCPPFEGESLLHTLDKVRNQPPIPPSRLNPALDRDLETVCLACLEKSPSRRYASAGDLAVDLRRFLAGMPVHAYRATWWQRGMKLARRHPWGSSFVGLFAAVLLAFVATVTSYGIRLRGALNESERRGDFLRHSVYSLQVQRAASVVMDDPRQAHELLNDAQRCPDELRDFCWHHLQAITRREVDHWDQPDPVTCLAAAPLKDLFATGDAEGVVRIWSPDAFKPLREIRPHQAAVTAVAFSPDGQSLASCSEDGTTSVWATAGDEPPASFEPAKVPSKVPTGTPADRTDEKTTTGAAEAPNLIRINAVAFSPDSRRLATAQSNGKVRVWMWPEQTLEIELDAGTDSVFRVSFSADGRLLAGGSRDATLRVWKLDSAQPIASAPAHRRFVSDVQFHPRDPSQLASAGDDGEILLWAITTAGELKFEGTLRTANAPTSALTYSRDGRFLAAGSYDRSAHIWEVATRRPVSALRDHHTRVTAVAFKPEGELLTGEQDGRVHRWRAHDHGNEANLVADEPRPITGLAYTPNGNLVSCGYDGLVHVWSGNEHAILANWGTGDQWVNALAAGRAPGQLVWESGGAIHLGQFDGKRTLTARRITTDSQLPTALTVVTQSDLLVVADLSGLTAFRLLEGTTAWTWPSNPIACLASAGSSGLVAFVDSDAQVWVADATRGRFRLLTVLPAVATCLAFSPDGHAIALGLPNGEAAVHETASGKDLFHVMGHVGAITHVGYSEDGRTLATGGEDGNVRFWDPMLGVQRMQLSAGSPVRVFAFSVDSRELACGFDDGQIRIWSAAGPASPTLTPSVD